MPLHDTTHVQHSHLTNRVPLTRRAVSVALAATLATIVALSLSGTVAASNDDGPRGCTLATLKGRYLFADAGTLYPPAFGVARPTPAANAGFHLFNGDGTGTDTVTLRVGGAIVLENAVVPISYTVNADCTGTLSVHGGPSFGVFVSPDGEAIASIATDPGNYVSSIDRRVSRK
jgi:hypothetical protein